MAFLGHSIPREAARYTRAASRARPADRGLGRLSQPQNVSNLPTGLGTKPRKQLDERGHHATMAGPEGLEPSACRLEVGRSIQLS